FLGKVAHLDGTMGACFAGEAAIDPCHVASPLTLTAPVAADDPHLSTRQKSERDVVEEFSDRRVNVGHLLHREDELCHERQPRAPKRRFLDGFRSSLHARAASPESSPQSPERSAPQEANCRLKCPFLRETDRK